MDNQDDSFISELFEKIEIPAVSADEIEFVCDTAANYLPNTQKKTSFWEIILLELSTVSLLFWAICAAIMVFSAIMIRYASLEISAIAVIAVISPIPLLLCIIELLKNRNPAVTELEKVCKYNITQLYVAKLMIGLFCNLVFLSFITVFAAGRDIDVVRIMLTGSTVMFLLGFIALIVTCKIGKSLPVMGVLAGWILISSVFISQDNYLVEIISNIQLMGLAAFFIISVVLFSYYLYVFAKQIQFLRIGDIEV